MSVKREEHEKELVFCTDCVWFEPFRPAKVGKFGKLIRHAIYEYCNSPSNQVTKATYKGYVSEEKWQPAKQNEKCDCEYFRRK